MLHPSSVALRDRGRIEGRLMGPSHKQIKRGLWRIFAAGGWALSILLAWQLNQTKPAIVTQSPNRPEPVVHTMTPAAAAPPMSEVYLRPHPNGFPTGRWIRFHTFSKRLNGALEIVDFKTNDGLVSAPSESVDWPKQRTPQEYR